MVRIKTLINALLVVFLYFFCSTSVWAATTTVTNIQAFPTSVPTFSKFEASFTISRSFSEGSFLPYYFYDSTDTPAAFPGRVSPYGIDGITVNAKYTSPSGKVLVVPAFYYQDYSMTQNTQGNAVLTPKPVYLWKTRFAPEEVGKYTFVIEITDANGSSQYPAAGVLPLSFTSTTSTNPGFIRTSPRDSRFLEFSNGTSFLPISAGRQWWAGDSRAYNYISLFSTWKTNGINFTRIWTQNDGYGLTIEGHFDHYQYPDDFNPVDRGINISTLPKGTQINQRGSYELDKIVEAAEQNGVYMEVSSHGDPYWIWDISTYQNEGWNPNPVAFDNPQYVNYWKRNIRYRTARWGYSTSLLSWEIWNEHGHVPTSSDVYRFYQLLGQYQSITDPYKHLRTTSQGSQAWSPAFWASSAMDIANYHDYLMSCRYGEFALDEANFVYNMAQCLRIANPLSNSKCYVGDTSSWTGSAKPIIWGELDTGTFASSCQWDVSNPSQRADHNMLWAGLFSPIAGSGVDWYWNNKTYLNQQYQEKKVAADFFKNIDYIGKRFTYLSTSDVQVTSTVLTASHAKIRALALRASTNNEAYLWVQNKDYTWANQSSTPAPVSGTISLPGMASGTYTATTTNTYTGAVISTASVTAANGVVAVPVSNLSQDVAIKVISQSVPPPTPTPTPSTTPLPSSTPTPTPNPTPSPTPQLYANGDVNNDGQVTTADLTALLGVWSATPTLSSDQFIDGKINSLDFSVVRRQLLAQVVPTPTPNPTPTSTPRPTPTPTPTSTPIPTPTPTPSPTSTPGITSTDWTQHQKDAQHSGRTSAYVDPSYEVAWAWADKTHIVKNFQSVPGSNIFDKNTGYKFTIGFAQQMQPIVAEGKTYFGGMDGRVYAVNALTGDNLWDYGTGGAILNTLAYYQGTLIVASMDGKIYGLNATTGTLKWSQPAQIGPGSGFNAAPIIHGSNVYIGNRDGKFYSLNATTGSINWVNDNVNAPIVSTAAVTEDGATVIFGAENMNVYALNASTGALKWNKKVIGQSFLYSWPVIKDNRVIIRTESSLIGAEEHSTGIEQVLDSLPDGVSWTQEKSAILNWLSANPYQKSMYVFDVNSGAEPYQVAMGRVTGNNYPAHLPVIDNSGRLLSYWRTRDAYFVTDGPCFGTKYCPDISAMDMTTGDRIRINNPSSNRMGPELDNGFQFTVGGNYLYIANHFRGTAVIRLTDGQLTRMSAPVAKYDGGDFRGWGYQIIYYGNDSEPATTYNSNRPERIYNETIGFTGITIATTNNTTMLYVNEGDGGVISAIRHKP